MRALASVAGLACGSPHLSDGEAYAAALNETASHEAAFGHCDAIENSDLRGDCRVAVLETWGRLELSICEALSAPLWRDECLFKLGESQWQTGDLEAGLQTCEQTRFRRNCAWHLVQYEVNATLQLPPVEAEGRILGFAASDSMPDAAFQFWLIRFREQAGDGLQLNELDCDGLEQPEACRDGIRRHVVSSLRTKSRRHLEELCGADPGERVRLKGDPAWAPGPITLEAEAQWVASHCETEAGTD